MELNLILLLSMVVNVGYCLDEVLRAQLPLYGISTLAEGGQNESLCHRQLFSLGRSVEEHQVWALNALDASGHPSSGFFYGNNLWLGSHAQCADISNQRRFEISYKMVEYPDATPYDFPEFPMGFFMAYLEHNSTRQHHTQLPLEFIIQLGLCAPKSCTPDDLQHLLERYLENKYLIAQDLYDLSLNVTFVRALEDGGLWVLTLPKIICLLVIVTALLILAIVGTCYDVKKHNRAKNMVAGYRNNIRGKKSLGNVSEVELVSNSSSQRIEPSTAGEIIKCFSIYSNVKNLVKTDLPADSVPVIHGLKLFGMLWVILVHAVFFQADYMDNVPMAYRLSEDIFAQILSNSTYCVDTFLFLSGFLVSYLFYKCDKNRSDGSVNYARKIVEFVMMFLNRFMRLTPPYMIVVLFSDVMYSYYRKTSSLYSSEHNDVTCGKYWWRNLLYVNNLFPRTEMCLSWSWYLSVDTQFFTVAIFLLIVSTISFKTSAVITVVLIVVNMIATAYTSYSIGYIPTMDEQLRQLDAIYDLPWNRIGPYLVGVITAYILLVKLKKTLVLKERTRIMLWILFPLLNLWILFTLYTRNLTVEFSAFYMGVSRTLWGIGLAWLLIACCTGNARALEKFLSFKGWIPLSRLTYCAYLLNPILANMIYLGTEKSLNASLASFALSTQGVALTTFFSAFLLSLLVESPCILLTKMLFKWVTSKPRSRSETPPQNVEVPPKVVTLHTIENGIGA